MIFKNRIESNNYIITLRKDDIVHVVFKEDAVLDTTLQLEMLDKYIEITKGVPHLFIFDAMLGVEITKEARENASNLETKAPIIAGAIIAKTLAYKMIANFYIKFNKPKHPYKVFNDFNKAVEWLKTINPNHTFSNEQFNSCL